MAGSSAAAQDDNVREGWMAIGGVGLFACVGGFEVAAGGVGLGLISAASGSHLVEADGLAAVVEEIEHLARVELGAAAEPIAAVGLLCGL